MLVAVGVGAVLAGCTSGNGTAQAPSPSATPIVLIGDSIPYNSPDDCPGCDGFADAYAAALTEARGESYIADNHSRHDGAKTTDILEQVESGGLDEALGQAAIVIVSAGFNDQAPFGPGAPCYDSGIDLDSIDGAAQALAGTTSKCFATQNAATGADLHDLLQGVRSRAPEAVVLALTSYNSWTGWADLDAAGPRTAALVTSKVAEGLASWRTIVCDEVAAIDGECVDLLGSFNGAEGTDPAGDLLAADYTHPSQAGNDRILEELLAVEG